MKTPEYKVYSLPGKLKCNVVLSLCLLLCYPLTATSASNDVSQLLALNLEQLLTISIASKREERIETSPAVVAVITAADIENYGAKTLRDILDRQTSLQIIGSNLFPHNRASIRGIATSHIDNNILLHVNGRPLREANFSSLNHDIYSLFPLVAIEKIEIIRGPGSVLYGTNAFNGVINIITKQSDTDYKGIAKLSHGSFDSSKVEMYGNTKGNDWSMNLAAGALDFSGDEFNVTDEFSNKGMYPTGVRGEQLLINANYKNLTINTLYSNSNTDTVRSIFVFPATDNEIERTFVDVGYRHDLTANWDIAVNFLHHRVNTLLTVSPPPASPQPKSRSENNIIELTSRIKPDNNLNVLLGAIHNETKGDGETSFDDYALGFYTQLDYQINESLKAIAGTQYNRPDALSGKYSPRIGLIYGFSKQWTLKLLHSSAYREASALERYIDVATIRGDPLLSPETIDTSDIQLLYTEKSHSFSMTYFHSKQKDIISRQPGTPVRVVNAGTLSYQGAEIEGRYEINQQWNLLGNMSYQNNDETYSPDVMIKMGVSYDNLHSYQLSLFNAYFAESVQQNDAAVIINSPAKSYNLLTANVRLNLGKILKNSSLKAFDAELYVDNILDEDIYFPSISRTRVNSLPHYQGRGFYLSLTGTF